MIQKISIVGNSGAGKSTLAHQLKSELGIEVYTIDKIYWKSGWTLQDQASFRETHDKWLNRDAWIIDGVGYWDELKSRLHQSDLIIFLDVPAPQCKQQALTRVEEERNAPNPHIAPGCVYGDAVDLQLRVIDVFETDIQPKLLALLSRFDSRKIRIINGIAELNLK